MAAYLIFIRERTINQAEVDTYYNEVQATLPGHALTLLARYGKQEALEGPAPEGVVLATFPTLAEAKAWYDSPEYKKVREHRFKGAEFRTILVEGLPTQSAT